MTASLSQKSLTTKSTASLAFAFLVWATFCASPSTPEQSREQLARQVAQIHASLHRHAGRSGEFGVSAAIVVETSHDEFHPAEPNDVVIASNPPPIVGRCSNTKFVRSARIVLSPEPDHLIELPGTPPPSAV